MGKLASKAVESLAKAASPGKTNDGDGLYFQVSRGGATSWVCFVLLTLNTRRCRAAPVALLQLPQQLQVLGDDDDDENNGEVEEEKIEKKKYSKRELNDMIHRLEVEMKEAASRLDFERATELRDVIFELKDLK